MKLAQYLRAGDRPPSAAEILHALIDHGDIRFGPDGQAIVSFSPDAATLDALMAFDAHEREHDMVDEGRLPEFVTLTWGQLALVVIITLAIGFICGNER
jgi:hypothetical protein